MCPLFRLILGGVGRLMTADIVTAPSFTENTIDMRER